MDEHLDDAEKTIGRLWRQYVDLKSTAIMSGDIKDAIAAAKTWAEFRRSVEAYTDSGAFHAEGV